MQFLQKAIGKVQRNPLKSKTWESIDFTLLSFVKTFGLNVEYEFQNLCQLESQPLIALYCIDRPIFFKMVFVKSNFCAFHVFFSLLKYEVAYYVRFKTL